MTLNEIQVMCKKSAASVVVKIVNEDGDIIEKPFNLLTAVEARQNRASITDQIANAYCDAQEAGDEAGRDRNWAAILLFNWFRIYEWMNNSSSLGLNQTDFFDWLNDALDNAFYYRSWRPYRLDKQNDGSFIWIENPQYKPDEYNCADKSINYFIGAKRGKEYQAANKDKRKGNFQNLSIDATFDEDGYCVLDRDGLYTEAKTYDGVHELVMEFLSEKKPIEAIIVDSMVYGDSFRDRKVDKTYKSSYVDDDGVEQEEDVTVTGTTSDFDQRKLVKYLNTIDEEYFIRHFMPRYEVTNYKPIMDELKSLNNGKLYKAIERTIMTIRSNPKLLEMLK